MKIAVLSFYSGHLGRGVESYVDQFATNLNPHHQVDVFQSGPTPKNKPYKTYSFPVQFPSTWPDDTLPATHILKRLFIHYYKRKEFLFFLKALPTLVKNNYDAIYPTNSGWPVPILRLITFFTKTKLIIAGHSGPGWDDYWHLLWKPDIFICFTLTQLKWAKHSTIWKSQKFAQIYHAVDTKQFTPKGKKKKVSLQKPIIITVAASEEGKRVEQGIKAISKLKKGSLLLLGRGPLDKKINKLGVMLLGKNRFFHTSVPHSQMPDYYRAADLFAFTPHEREAFGLVYLEALATNLPVVATDDPTRREIIGDAGLFIDDPDNTEKYAKVLESTLAKKWRNLPRERAKDFSLESVFSGYLGVLESLTKQ